MIGYLYQCELALVELLSRGDSEPGLTLFLEKLDDVQIEATGRPIEILQLKHHTVSGGDLRDRSVDLWRTLNVWMSALDELESDETPRFTLLTTSTAPPGSAASQLRDDEHRDTRQALMTLRNVASEAGAQATLPFRERFAALDPHRQERLLNAIAVRDNTPHIEDLDDEIAKLLQWAIRPEQQVIFIERLKGWWYSRCVELLLDRFRAISTSDVAQYVHTLRDDFHPENLPFDFDVPDPSIDEHASYRSRTFVRQLQLVAASNELISLAIIDYHRAFANSSRWSREGFLLNGELGRYERRLIEEWQRRYEFMKLQLPPGVSEAERQAAGIQLWREVSDSTLVQLRPRMAEQLLTRGTYHGLADETRVGWHVDFVERLRLLLEEAV